MTERADVIVLGLGVGGEEVADTLAARGLNVVGIESNLLGGECPYYGCIPTKMMVRGDDLLAEGRINALMAHWLLVSPRLVEAVRGGGGELYVWTVDDARRIEQLSRLGVDGVITNDPRLNHRAQVVGSVLAERCASILSEFFAAKRRR